MLAFRTWRAGIWLNEEGASVRVETGDCDVLGGGRGNVAELSAGVEKFDFV